MTDHAQLLPSEWSRLRQKLQERGIREQDLQEIFVRSSGPGGQHVNKVATCVVLRHRPSGTIVRCQEARTQGQNRLIARRLLLEKIEKGQRQEEQKNIQQKEKLRRKKRRRSKAAKEVMLEQKRHRAQKKLDRHKIRAIE